MKIKIIPFSLVVGASALLITPAIAQEFVDYTLTPQTVTIATTVKSVIPGTFVTEEDPETGKPVKVPAYESFTETFDKLDRPTRASSTFSAKVTSKRYGNAEIIKDCADAGLLPDENPKGWALLANVEEGEEGTVITVFARKNGQEDVDLSGFVGMEAYGGLYSGNSTTTTTFKYADADDFEGVGTTTGSGAYAVEGAAFVDLPGDVSLSGAFTDSGSEFRWYPDPLNKLEQAYLFVSKGARFTGLAGFGGIPAEGAEQEADVPPTWVVGTASLGAAKAVKVVMD